MNPEIKKTILDALNRSSAADDLYRAERTFANCTPEQMQQSSYGLSGQTRQEILDGYRRSLARTNAAIAWAEAEGGAT